MPPNKVAGWNIVNNSSRGRRDPALKWFVGVTLLTGDNGFLRTYVTLLLPNLLKSYLRVPYCKVTVII